MEIMSSKYLSVIIFVTFVSSLYISAEAKRDKSSPIVIDENSWSQLLEGEWMFDLYAPWCPACKILEPEWRKFAEWSDDLNINVASADVTLNPGLSGRFMVRGLPTIYHVKDGVFRIYNGPREHTAMINFIEENGWKKIEPVSRWFAPNTFQMSAVAYAFRVSMLLRDVHNHLVDNVGLPYYVSYLIFAFGTVALGTILGILLVFIVDQFAPVRYSEQPQDTRPVSARRKKDKKDDSDLDDVDEAKEQKPESSSEKLRKRTKN